MGKIYFDNNLTKEELLEIIKHSYDGIVVTDNQGNIILCNKSYLTISSIPSDNIIGTNLRDLIARGYLTKSMILDSITLDKVITGTHPDLPNRTGICSATPIHSESTGKIKMVIANVRDMTEIYELNEKLLKAKEMEELYYELVHNSENNPEEEMPIATSDAMREIVVFCKKISDVDVTTLILGESGVGKEVIAKHIHQNSRRAKQPFITINCGAIPEQLLESELFGYVGGAFTGALKTGKMGLFEAAHGGTLFLDEIGELPLNLQVKLLRVLETHEVQRIGAVKPTPIDVRLLSATNRNLEEMVKNLEFRDDLFYRLNVVQIEIPPLRSRTEDIAPLSMHFLNIFNTNYRQEKRMSHEVLKQLERYNWPGNIRELKNVIERLVVVSAGEYLEVTEIPFYKKIKEQAALSIIVNDLMPMKDAIEELEKNILIEALERFGSTRKIADALDLNQSTIVRKIRYYGLRAVE